MPAVRLSMRNIREVLRLQHAGRSRNQIAESLGISRSSVTLYLRRAHQAGLNWPIDPAVDDEAIERLLFPEAPPLGGERPVPDWHEIDRELRRKGVTLMLLWHEYKARYPENGYNYSRFCDLYRRWRGSLDLVMRQEHKAGEKLFVDYAGQTVTVDDARSGRQRQAQIFVAVMGASNYTYAEATWTQSIEDWTGSHRRCFEFLGGVPEIVVPDNLRSGVTRAHRYDPELNRTYADVAEHYGVAVIPTRVRRPRDKAKAESAVQLVQRWILAALRDGHFTSLADLNRAIGALLDQLNSKAFQKIDGSRRSLFEAVDRPALRALPQQPYVFAEWRQVAVGADYHITVDGHHYSVPHAYARQRVDVRLSASSVEVFRRHRRIAAHWRSERRGSATTLRAHMPASHQRHAELTPQRLAQWAAASGPATAELVARILAARAHPEQGCRTCLGLQRLERSYGRQRMEATARRALAIGSLSYRSIESILRNNLDRTEIDAEQSAPDSNPQVITHPNIRGSQYYTESTHGTEPAYSTEPALDATPTVSTEFSIIKHEVAHVDASHD